MSLLSVPLKTVLCYHADAINEAIPESYEICDGRTLNSAQQDINAGGSYTLPNLLNTFPLFADVTKAAGNGGDYTVSSAAGAPGPKGTGGANIKTLAVGEIPPHTHTATTNTAGAHTHAGSTANSGGAHVHTASSTSAGAHTHAGSITDSQGSHNHTASMSNVRTVYGAGGSGFVGITGFNVSGFNDMQILAGAGGNVNDVVYRAFDGTITIGTAGAHAHNLSIVSDGTHSHTITVDSGGAHTHTLTLVSDGGHTHSFSTDSTGGGTAFDLRPRFYGLIPIMKVRK